MTHDTELQLALLKTAGINPWQLLHGKLPHMVDVARRTSRPLASMAGQAVSAGQRPAIHGELAKLLRAVAMRRGPQLDLRRAGSLGRILS